jgi:hypothetical protein
VIKAPSQAVAQIEKHVEHFTASAFLSLTLHFWEFRRQIRERSEGLAELLEAPALQFDFLG